MANTRSNRKATRKDRKVSTRKVYARKDRRTNMMSMRKSRKDRRNNMMSMRKSRKDRRSYHVAAMAMRKSRKDRRNNMMSMRKTH